MCVRKAAYAKKTAEDRILFLAFLSLTAPINCFLLSGVFDRESGLVLVSRDDLMIWGDGRQELEGCGWKSLMIDREMSLQRRRECWPHAGYSLNIYLFIVQSCFFVLDTPPNLSLVGQSGSPAPNSHHWPEDDISRSMLWKCFALQELNYQ